VRAWRRWRCGLAAALVAPLWLAPEAAQADADLRVVSFNICGAICNKGRTGGLVEHVRDVLVGSDAHVAILNEVCRPQYERLRRLLTASGHPMNGAFHAQREDRRCPGGFGDAVLTTGDAGEAEVIRLPNRSEKRSILCVPSDVHRRLTLCGLHLVAADKQWNARQWREVVDHAGRIMGDSTLVLAGDFNRDPGQMDALNDRMHDAGAGRGEHTHGRRRIDFVLLEKPAFHDVRADVRWSKYSDHRIVLARARVSG
jgi:endonuclease/exonuclease/phosphatase family metal-dependent hydrolase